MKYFQILTIFVLFHIAFCTSHNTEDKILQTPQVQEGLDDLIQSGFGAFSGVYSQYVFNQQTCFGSAWQLSQDLLGFAQYNQYTFFELEAWVTYFIDVVFFVHDFIYSLQNCGYSLSLSAPRQNQLWFLKQTNSKIIPDSVSAILRPIMIVLEGINIYISLSNQYKYFFTKHITSFVTGLLYLIIG